MNPQYQTEEDLQFQAVSEQVKNTLNAELNSHAQWVSDELSRTKSEREAVKNQIERIAKSLHPQASTYIYGSIAQGIALQDSDIDIAITGIKCGCVKDRLVEEQNRIFDKLQSELGPFLIESKNIETAQIPIIKLELDSKIVSTSSSRVIKVDLTIVDADDYQKLEKLKEAVRFVQESIERWPALKPVILFLKRVFIKHDLLDLYTGGISSYSL